MSVDQRLICRACGEIGRLVQDSDRWLVTCGGPRCKGVCCQTFKCESAERAIDHWQHMHEYSLDDRESAGCSMEAHRG